MSFHSKMTQYLGTKFSGHDSAVCVLDFDQRSIFAISTERVTRIKHDSMDISPILKAYPFPASLHVAHCYSDFADLSGDGELRAKMVFTKVLEKLIRRAVRPKYLKDLLISKAEKRRALYRHFVNEPSSFFRYVSAKFHRALSKNDAASNKLAHARNIANILAESGIRAETIRFYDHHLCHALPSYVLSGFSSGPVLSLTLDGQGDGYWSKLFLFRSANDYELVGSSKAHFVSKPNLVTSIGRIYSLFTKAMGLIPDSDEGKVEAYAAYGDEDEVLLSRLMSLTNIDMQTLEICFDVLELQKVMDSDHLESERLRIGDPGFCATVQKYLETVVLDYIRSAVKKTGVRRLCLSGGVAANIIMSLRIYEAELVDEIFVLPPMGDDGLALGSALLMAIDDQADINWVASYKMPYFGDKWLDGQILDVLASRDDISYEFVSDRWPEFAAQEVSDGKICALFQGRMEFGPRALGNRSIIASPCLLGVTNRINSGIKRRPWYQPFCPSILEEERDRLFEKSFSHKHMAIAFRMKSEFVESLPGATHVDQTARPQFVSQSDNPLYHRYLLHLKDLTGFGVSLNTSFNLHGRTIVRTPTDAVDDFIDCGLDVLYIGGYRVTMKVIKRSGE